MAENKENKEEKKPEVRKTEYLVLENFTWDRQYVKSEKIQLTEREAKDLLTNKFIK